MLSHTGTKQISSDRLILRRFTVSDTKQLYENLTNDREVAKFLGYIPHKEERETENYINRIISKYNNLNYYKWAIVAKGGNEIIGEISIVQIDSKNPYACEIGYSLSRKFWGYGYATEALRTVVEYLFLTVNFNRIEALHDLENIASEKVIIKNGFICEGILKQSEVRHGEFYDLKLYALTRDTYMEYISE